MNMPRNEHQQQHRLSLSSMEVGVEEKRAKREIANQNERRRMQNINAGFHTLRNLLPKNHQGEKLSKAAILQHTASYVYQLQKGIDQLVTQNMELKRLTGQPETVTLSDENGLPEWILRLPTQPPDCLNCKRRKYENRLDCDSSPLNGDGSSTESSSEHDLKYGRNSSSYGKQNQYSKATVDQLRSKLHRVEKKLEDERRIRMSLENSKESFGSNVSGGGSNATFLSFNDRSQPFNSSSAINDHQQHHHNHPLQMVADEVEVASESLEIEMHSCPASPPEISIIAANDILNSNQVYQPSHTNNHYQTQIETIGPNHHFIETNSKINSVSANTAAITTTQMNLHHRVQKQNAIALPIDVPFLPQDAMDVNDHTTTISNKLKPNGNGPVLVVVDAPVMLMDPSKTLTSTTTSSTSSSSSLSTIRTTEHPKIVQIVSHDGTTKHLNIVKMDNLSDSGSNSTAESKTKSTRQNLNNIVEAIRLLEGDGLFKKATIVNSNQSDKVKIIKDDNETTSVSVDLSMPKANGNGSVGNASSDLVNSTKTNGSMIQTVKKIETDSISLVSASPSSSATILTFSNSTSSINGTASIHLLSNGSSDHSTTTTNSSSSAATTPRPQIIQIHQRPNVIVANSGEN